MPLIHLFILAVVQAATEFLPVSSSGHLIILDELTDIESNLAVDVMLHMGTLLALLVYYRQRLAEIARDLMRRRSSRLFTNIIVSSVPAVVIGLFFENALTGDVRSLSVVVVMLLTVGLIMIFEDYLLPSKATRKIDSLEAWRALGIGTAQSLALIPGTSRSGSSIIGGRLFGLNNKDAADYAFLIGTPVIFGAGVKTLFESDTREVITSAPVDVLFGVLVAAIVGWLAIDILLRLLKRFGLKWFGVYRVALALILLLVIT